MSNSKSASERMQSALEQKEVMDPVVEALAEQLAALNIAQGDYALYSACTNQRLLKQTLEEKQNPVHKAVWSAVERYDCVTSEDVLDVVSVQASAMPVEYVLLGSADVKTVAESTARRIVIGLYVLCITGPQVEGYLCYFKDVQDDVLTKMEEDYEYEACPEFIEKYCLRSKELFAAQEKFFLEAHASTERGLDYIIHIESREKSGVIYTGDYDIEHDEIIYLERCTGLSLKIYAECSPRRGAELSSVVHEILNRVLIHALTTNRLSWELLSRRIIDLQSSPHTLDTIARSGVWKMALELYFGRFPKGHYGSNLHTTIELGHKSIASKSNTECLTSSVAGLETLLNPSKQNISEKLASRSAYLLAPDSNERPKWTRQFVRLYNERSLIVHGRTTKVTEEDAESTLVWYIEVLRAMFHYCQYLAALDDGIQGLPSLQDLVKKIDDDFIAGRVLETGFVARKDLARILGIQDD